MCWGQCEEGSADAAGFADTWREPAASVVTEDHLMSTKLAEKNALINKSIQLLVKSITVAKGKHDTWVPVNCYSETYGLERF